MEFGVIGMWVEAAVTYLWALCKWLYAAMQWVLTAMVEAINTTWEVLCQLGDWITAGARVIKNALGRAFGAFAHLNFSSIWRAVKRAYDRFRRALAWYQKHVQAPLDRLRRTIWDLYNRFFRPIIRVIDSFRVFIRMIAIFDRRLAAKLDGALFRLEAKIMYPITALLKRVNELSSYTRAIITSLGLLDRVLLLESLRRDALLVWEVLTNPRGRIYGPIVHPEPRTQSRRVNDSREFLAAQTGYYRLAADRLDGVWAQLREEAG